MCFVFIAKFSNDFKRCQILVEMLKRFPDTIPKIGVSIYIGIELIDSVCVCVYIGIELIDSVCVCVYT